MKLHPRLSPAMQQWINQQPLFFVASAPLATDGHVNLSPRGYDCLRIIDEHTVAWLDLTGSGNETAAHVQENGRITLMFCAFQGEAQILRLYGRGEILLPGTDGWNSLRDRFEDLPGARQIVRVAIDRIQTSCGYGVPLMEPAGERQRLLEWARKKGEDGMQRYREDRNGRSIDGTEIRIKAK
jgi:hypothetical protein